MDALLSHPYILAGGFIVTWLWLRSGSTNPKGLPVPPGPRGIPFIGLTSIPTKRPWEVYHDWSKTYGDVMFFKYLGQPYLILSSMKSATDLFDGRYHIYSDRPRMPMIVELMDSKYAPFLPYGQDWRRRRRVFTEHFHYDVVHRYEPIQTEETRAFLRRLLISPKKLRHHIRHTFSATIMRIVYGIKITGTTDPYILRAEKVASGITKAAANGAFLVDAIPALKYVPSWFPGAGFKKFAEHYKEINHTIIRKPFEAVQEQVKQGSAPLSVVSKILEKLPEDTELRKDELEAAQDSAAVAYLGGANTTISGVHTFFLAMAMHPEVQRKAQAQLDSVTGGKRLPEFSDRPRLPYIDAIVKEVLRWQTITPLAVPHYTSHADEYEGYHIPKGTIVIGNAWAILHDPNAFEAPEEFRPERYMKDGQLDPTVRDPEVAGFGFGHRTCPGRQIVVPAMYGLVSHILSVYNITPPVDQQGNTIPLRAVMQDTVLTEPAPFDCIIKPRSAFAEGLIRATGEFEAE